MNLKIFCSLLLICQGKIYKTEADVKHEAGNVYSIQSNWYLIFGYFVSVHFIVWGVHLTNAHEF